MSLNKGDPLEGCSQVLAIMSMLGAVGLLAALFFLVAVKRDKVNAAARENEASIEERLQTLENLVENLRVQNSRQAESVGQVKDRHGILNQALMRHEEKIEQMFKDTSIELANLREDLKKLEEKVPK